MVVKPGGKAARGLSRHLSNGGGSKVLRYVDRPHVGIPSYSGLNEVQGLGDRSSPGDGPAGLRMDKPLLHQLIDLRAEQSEDSVWVENDNRFAVHAQVKGHPGFEYLLQRANTARQRQKTVGAFIHTLFPLPHVVGHQEFVGVQVGDLKLEEGPRNHPDGTGAEGPSPACHLTHAGDGTSAGDESMAAAPNLVTDFCREFQVVRLDPVGRGAVDADVHRTIGHSFPSIQVGALAAAGGTRTCQRLSAARAGQPPCCQERQPSSRRLETGVLSKMAENVSSCSLPCTAWASATIQAISSRRTGSISLPDNVAGSTRLWQHHSRAASKPFMLATNSR